MTSTKFRPLSRNKLTLKDNRNNSNSSYISNHSYNRSSRSNSIHKEILNRRLSSEIISDCLRRRSSIRRIRVREESQKDEQFLLSNDSFK